MQQVAARVQQGAAAAAAAVAVEETRRDHLWLEQVPRRGLAERGSGLPWLVVVARHGCSAQGSAVRDATGPLLRLKCWREQWKRCYTTPGLNNLRE